MSASQILNAPTS